MDARPRYSDVQQADDFGIYCTATDCDMYVEAIDMAKNKHTGKKAASNAGKVLSDPKSSKAAKSAAASAPTQAPDKKKK